MERPSGANLKNCGGAAHILFTVYCQLFTDFAPVAQLVEQRTENPRVVGSIPIGSTMTVYSAKYAVHSRKQLCDCIQKVLNILLSTVHFALYTNSRGFSSSGRAPPCQGGGSEFEPRNPLQQLSWYIFSLFRISCTSLCNRGGSAFRFCEQKLRIHKSENGAIAKW